MAFTRGIDDDTWPMEQLEAEVARHSRLVARIHEVAAERLDRGDVVIPPWAYDGVHASSKAHYGWADKRFPGTLEAFDNCLRMVGTYGRLDPRDQGILDGCQVPEAGLVLCNDFLDEIHL